MSDSPARSSLRRLCVPHAVTFGASLLHRARDGCVPFRDFVAVARELIAASPDQAAVYLAALVALDMQVRDGDVEATTPSSN